MKVSVWMLVILTAILILFGWTTSIESFENAPAPASGICNSSDVLCQRIAAYMNYSHSARFAPLPADDKKRVVQIMQEKYVDLLQNDTFFKAANNEDRNTYLYNQMLANRDFTMYMGISQPQPLPLPIGGPSGAPTGSPTGTTGPVSGVLGGQGTGTATPQQIAREAADRRLGV